MTMVKGVVYLVLAVTLMASAVYWRGQGGQPTPSEIVGGIERKLADEISSFINETNALESATSQSNPWPEVKNAFFLSDSSGVIQWSTSQYFPDFQNLTIDSLTYFKSGTNHYLVLRRTFKNYFLTGYLPLQRGFSIQNQYLSTELNHSIIPYPGVTLDVGGEIFPVQYKGKIMFPISINASALVNKPTLLSWGLLVSGLVLAFMALRIFIIPLIRVNQRLLAVGFITVAIVVIRMVMVYGHFPGVSTGWTVFDPRIFASSTFNDSIGNLLLNTIGLGAIAFFVYWIFKDQQLLNWRRKSLFAKAVGVTMLLILCFVAQVLPFLYLETIYHNSSLTPDVSQQLYFDSTRLCALFCIILSGVTGLLFLFIFLRLSIRITRTNFNLFLVCLAIALVASLLYHLLTDRHYEVPIALTVLNLLVLTFSAISRKWKFVLTGSFSIIFFELIILGTQTALAIQWLSVEREREAMVKFGNTFSN
jgi:two-component system, NtrC family, nitrogen regulation sensor histidine kinase NtrY